MTTSDNITSIKGVGKALAATLDKNGINTVGDLLGLLPSYYRDFSDITPVCNALVGNINTFCARIVSPPRWIKRSLKGGVNIFRMSVADGTGVCDITFFNTPFYFQKFEKTGLFLFSGKLTVYDGRLQLNNPLFCEPEKGGIIPFYPPIKGLSNNRLREMLKFCLENTELTEVYSEKLVSELELESLSNEFSAIHFPTLETLNSAELSRAKRQLFGFLSALNSRPQARAVPLKLPEQSEFERAFPFNLTADQSVAISQIGSDISQKRAMNRLLMGDVGSGKTAVAFYALYAAAKNGKHAFMMAPTQILAEQHFAVFTKLFPEISAILVTSKTSGKKTTEKIKTGEALVAFGTSAFLYTDFHVTPAVVVADEQHRFGVMQRAKFAAGAHTLIMSATPIPRSMALAMFSRSDISVLKEIPHERKVKTFIVTGQKRADMYEYLAAQVKSGKQAYIVCPLIEANPDFSGVSIEEMEFIKTLIPETAVIHGGMSSDEKSAVMANFKSGETKCLLATTVIEVGIDVPAAAIMIIESAELFGLSTLHQLRGRVGRSGELGYCYLVTADKDNARLNTISRNSDGFAIAEMDLTLRGAGTFLGTLQHGQSRELEALIANPEITEKINKIIECGNFASDVALAAKLSGGDDVAI